MTGELLCKTVTAFMSLLRRKRRRKKMKGRRLGWVGKVRRPGHGLEAPSCEVRDRRLVEKKNGFTA